MYVCMYICMYIRIYDISLHIHPYVCTARSTCILAHSLLAYIHQYTCKRTWHILMQRVFDESDAVPHGPRRLTLFVPRAVVVQVDGAAQREEHQQCAA
jgi:hypothetical protein